MGSLKNSLADTVRLGLAFGVVGLACLGCQEKKEKVLDIDVPGVDVEIERGEESGKVDVQVNGEG